MGWKPQNPVTNRPERDGKVEIELSGHGPDVRNRHFGKGVNNQGAFFRGPRRANCTQWSVRFMRTLCRSLRLNMRDKLGGRPP